MGFLVSLGRHDACQRVGARLGTPQGMDVTGLVAQLRRRPWASGTPGYLPQAARRLESSTDASSLIGLPMSLEHRNDVHISGDGPATLMFVHGFGCDQNMWRLTAPVFTDRFRTVTLDLVGSGRSDLGAYDATKYGSLDGYADDIVELVKAFGQGPVVFVGHSVSAMIGLLADLRSPGLFAGHVMVGPSPCYVDDDPYIGGFSREDIDSLLETMDSNYLGWSSSVAPAIMGAPGQPELGVELTNSFCRTDPTIAPQFARVTFLSDHRADVSRLQTPTLVIQSRDDFIAPVAVGQYLKDNLSQGSLVVVDNVGHCPHLSAPGACTDAMESFLRELSLP